MDLKNILDKEVNSSIEAEIQDIGGGGGSGSEIRTHKKPVQLRDIENRSSSTNTRDSNFDTEEDINHFLREEKQNSLKKPWNKLDQGMKINRIKNFCENQQSQHKLSESEHSTLVKMLLLACHGNKINKNTDVNYNTETCEIESIKALQFDESKRKYKIVHQTNSSKKNDRPKSKSQIDRFLKKSNSSKK